MAINTIAEERAYIASYITSNVSGLVMVHDHEPKQIGRTPVVTVEFAGFGPREAASTRKAKQVRLYDIRLYIGLEDWKVAADEIGSYSQTLWEKLTAIGREGDTANVILVQMGDTSINRVQDQQRQFVVATIRLEIEHRSSYQ